VNRTFSFTACNKLHGHDTTLILQNTPTAIVLKINHYEPYTLNQSTDLNVNKSQRIGERLNVTRRTNHWSWMQPAVHWQPGFSRTQNLRHLTRSIIQPVKNRQLGFPPHTANHASAPNCIMAVSRDNPKPGHWKNKWENPHVSSKT